MQQPANKRGLVAIDLGAQSCRVSLLRWYGGAPDVRVVHRFLNGPIAEQQSLRWDIRRIFAGVVEGLRACAASAPEGIAAAQLCLTAAPKIVSTGTIVGKIRHELNRLPELSDTTLIVPACHDTASAIAAIPASGEDWAFISSGTWSLVGVVLDAPNISADAKRMNFANLGGAGGKICFLKNVNGMWLLRQCMEDWARAGQAWTVEELIRSCQRFPAPPMLFDVDDPLLMLPGDMHGKINKQMEAAGFPAFAMNERDIPRMANAIFHSLAKRYADVLAAVSRITGKQLNRLFVVGGGSKNAYLNRLTAERSGLEVIAGPSECTTIGNFAIQLAATESDGVNSGGVTAERVTHYAQVLATQTANSEM